MADIKISKLKIEFEEGEDLKNKKFKLAGHDVNGFNLKKYKKLELIEYVVLSSVINNMPRNEETINLKNQIIMAESDDEQIVSNIEPVLKLLDEQNLKIENIAIYLAMQKPRLNDNGINRKTLMKQCIQKLFKTKNVNVEAGSGEKVGFVGNSQGFIIMAYANLVNKNIINLDFVGFGYDRHRFLYKKLEEKPFLTFCGQKIEYVVSIDAHSDGDVILHSIINALLNAVGEGDIGDHFSDKDPTCEGKNSLEYLEIIMKLVREKCFTINELFVELICPEKIYEIIDKDENFIKNSLEIIHNYLGIDISNAKIHLINAEHGCVSKDIAVDCLAYAKLRQSNNN